MKKTRSLSAAVFALAVASACSSDARADEPQQSKTFTLQSIGTVEKTEDSTRIVLDKRFEPGLLGLDGFSHVCVFWWFDRNDTPRKRATLQVRPMGMPENPITGVFATRSPFRPNLIAMTLCKIKSVNGNVIEVERIDAFDGTAVLDLKPFIPGYDSVPEATVPDWLIRARKQREAKE